MWGQDVLAPARRFGCVSKTPWGAIGRSRFAAASTLRLERSRCRVEAAKRKTRTEFGVDPSGSRFNLKLAVAADVVALGSARLPVGWNDARLEGLRRLHGRRAVLQDGVVDAPVVDQPFTRGAHHDRYGFAAPILQARCRTIALFLSEKGSCAPLSPNMTLPISCQALFCESKSIMSSLTNSSWQPSGRGYRVGTDRTSVMRGPQRRPGQGRAPKVQPEMPAFGPSVWRPSWEGNSATAAQ